MKRVRARTGRVLSSGMAALLLALLVSLPTAAAQPSGMVYYPVGSHVGNSIVAYNAGGFLALTPAPGVPKDAWNPRVDADSVHGSVAGRQGISPYGSGWPTNNPALISGTHRDDITPPGGSQGSVVEYFNDSVPYSGAPASSAYFCGYSWAQWQGQNPYYATRIDLMMTWHVDGVVISVSYPPGFSFAGQDVSFTLSVYNTWSVYEDYRTCPISFGGILYNASETVYGNYVFGSSGFLRGPAYDSAVI